MDRQQTEISSLELTAEDLHDVSGGLNNNQTAAFRAVVAGMVKGFLEAGGNLTVAIWKR